MTSSTPVSQTTLQIRRTFQAHRDRAFRAWTDPEELKIWWGDGDGFSGAIAEVDLRPGGSYRLGMRPPEGDAVYVCSGTYREVRAPEKLVYTWAWELPTPFDGETLVTVEFIDRDGATEVVLTHELFSSQEARDEHEKGWNGVLDQLAKAL